MKRHFILFIIFISGANLVYSQTTSNLAPVKWEKYRADQNISVLLPKMPVRFFYGGGCSEIINSEYLVYSLDVIYGLSVYSKSKEKLPGYCVEKVYFDKNAFSERIRQLSSILGTTDRKNVEINGKTAVLLKNDLKSYWLFFDQKNDRWIELLTVNAPKDEQLVNDFVASLTFGDNSAGKEIGEGAGRILGDDLTADETTALAEREKSDTTTRKMFIFGKPRPRYTDLARRNNTQGVVTLRVTFLSNGTIGRIDPVKTLPDGLTEQAIYAARRMVFLPERREGKRISVTKTVQYSFSIF